ncbi:MULTISPECIES: hypothetical protein [unclassified Gordonia (in: high G+C Gram-positive bacteria)]|nr:MULTISPECIES: hypothetical protein [unclassified Gordonia (in: high G+C Gram-positive bacteria)]
MSVSTRPLRSPGQGDAQHLRAEGRVPVAAEAGGVEVPAPLNSAVAL